MRTFVFGAGASVHAGYPLPSGLWPAISTWALESCPPESLFRDVVQEISARFDVSLPFELVLTHLQEQIDALVEKKGDLSDAERIEKHTLLQIPRTAEYMIHSYFNMVRSQPADLYDRFATEVLMPGDAVITLNYDLALDRSMKRASKWTIRDGYGFEIENLALDLSPCALFKLHGSTNWRGQLFGGMEGFGQWNGPSLGDRPVIDRNEFEYLGYDGLCDAQCRGGRVRVESLIMPTANKRFYKQTSLGPEWLEFWNSLWSQAEYALKMSDEIYVVGYSLPEYDVRARDLFAKGMTRASRVEVCCHSATQNVVDSLKTLGVPKAMPCEARELEEFVSDNRMRTASRAA
jgi:hypothetical protein